MCVIILGPIVCPRVKKGLADGEGWREEIRPMPEIEASFMHPFSYAPLRRKGPVFRGLLVANPLPPTPFLGSVSETPTPTTCLRSMAVHLQFVRQYPPFVSPCFPGFQASKKGKPCNMSPICTAVRLPFVRQYDPPFVRQYFWKNTWGWGHRNVSVFSKPLTRLSVESSGPLTGRPEITTSSFLKNILM